MRVERFLAAAMYQKALTMHCIILGARSSRPPRISLGESDLQKSLEDLTQSRFNHRGAEEHESFHFDAAGT